MEERSGVVSLHLAAEISPDASKMTMFYKITEGPNQVKFYGLTLAKLIDFPPGVLETAHDVSEELNLLSIRRHSQTKALAIARKRKLILSLREQLLQARAGNMEGQTLRKWLKWLQDEFTEQMAAANGDIAGFDDRVDEYAEGPGDRGHVEDMNGDMIEQVEQSEDQQLLEASEEELLQSPTTFVSTSE
ncbi:hypothetical protein BDV12DRAFT_139387 [Aspergillus spectabilis]